MENTNVPTDQDPPIVQSMPVAQNEKPKITSGEVILVIFLMIIVGVISYYFGSRQTSEIEKIAQVPTGKATPFITPTVEVTPTTLSPALSPTKVVTLTPTTTPTKVVTPTASRLPQK